MIDVQSQIPLAPLTTFKIGGIAKHFVEVKTANEIYEAIQWAKDNRVRFAILAGGSNVLIADTGYDGLLIHIVQGDWIIDDAGVLSADAGCNLLSIIREAGAKGWGGWEKMAGIPGSIGGAARGNAGAFGTEIKDVARHIEAFNVATGDSRVFEPAECAFAYRQSFFKQHPEWIITQVSVSLRAIDPAASARTIDETIAEREKRHLQNVLAAGSFFMNPIAPPEVVAQFEQEKSVQSREGRVPAGWLIEKAGMKGFAIGGASASMQHPNYVVSDGHATAADVRAVAAAIIKAVENQFGITLREEAALL
jgi:UDP-N-acetylmuramate dehydrogenase